jgi:hypothetical protein
MAGDWLRLYRKSLSSRVFSDPWLWRLWSWCMMKAGWQVRWKHGRQLLPGQFATGRNEAAEQLNVSPSRIYRGLKTLQEWGEIRVEVNNRFSVITLCHWRVEQCETNSGGTSSEHLADSQRTSGGHPSLVEEGKEGEEGGNTGGARPPPHPPAPPFAPPPRPRGRRGRRHETLAQQIARLQQEAQQCRTRNGQDG